MPMPRWFTALTKHVFNPMELRRGNRAVIVHTGRTSGVEHRTPLDAHGVPGGWVMALVYGRESDWCQNALATGSARLEIVGRDVALTNPRIVSWPETREEITERGGSLAPNWLVPEALRMDEAA